MSSTNGKYSGLRSIEDGMDCRVHGIDHLARLDDTSKLKCDAFLTSSVCNWQVLVGHDMSVPRVFWSYYLMRIARYREAYLSRKILAFNVPSFFTFPVQRKPWKDGPF